MSTTILKKMYRNGRGGKWNARIQWYDQSDGLVTLVTQIDGDIKRKPDMPVEIADAYWMTFRNSYPYPDTRGVDT